MSDIGPTGGVAPGAMARGGPAVQEEGMVTVGGVTLSPADAAELVMLHRTAVMKKVGADRTEMAEQHLDRIKAARQFLTDLIGLGKFSDDAKSYHGRMPVTPDMVRFLKQEVGCTPSEYKNRVVYYGSGVSRLPPSVRDYYGFDKDGKGSGGDFTISHAGGKHTHDRHEIGNVTCIRRDDLDSLKEEVNNYIDQQNDGNNLFMTRFKSVVNSMNEALEGANSMADKSHDTLKNLVSRW